jgi:DNA-binding response OmpR family regulator
MRVLLIEADAATAAQIQVELHKARFAVDIARDSEAGLRMARRGVHALILVDAMLPGRDGFGVCQALCARRNSAPILMLAARDSSEDRIRAFESGADSYLSRPFDAKELLARVRALLRRGKVHKARTIQIADLEIDTWDGRVQRGGREHSLTPREFALLQALAVSEGQTLSRDIIREHVWGDAICGPDTVNSHVASLRKKIDAGHEIRLIHTVHGIGYVLRSPESEVAP